MQADCRDRIPRELRTSHYPHSSGRGWGVDAFSAPGWLVAPRDQVLPNGAAEGRQQSRAPTPRCTDRSHCRRWGRFGTGQTERWRACPALNLRPQHRSRRSASRSDDSSQAACHRAATLLAGPARLANPRALLRESRKRKSACGPSCHNVTSACRVVTLSMFTSA